MTTTKTRERDDAIAELRELLHPGDTVRVVHRHTSPSGMTRWLDLYIIRDDDTRRITWSAAKALGWTYSDRYDALKVDGCGMDMGFHAVYTLSRTLFADGFDCIAKPYRFCSECFSRADELCEGAEWVTRSEGCPSNDHNNREDHAHHSDGGYALNHRWL